MAHLAKRRRRTKSTVLSALAITLFVQLGFSFFLPWWHPDTEYRLRKELIHSRIAEHGDWPVLVMVGSSRVVSGFNPEDLSHLTAPSGQAVLSFNFGHVEAGPVCNLLQVKRLLRCGIKPDWLIVEVAPMYCAEERNLFVHNLGWEDVGSIAPYHSYRKFAGSFLRNHFLLPWYRHRGDFQQHYLGEHPHRPVQCNLSAYGWGGSLEAVDEQQRCAWTDRARQMFAPTLSDQFEIAPRATQAYRELLSLCRTEKIEVALLMMPEGDTFRNWYQPLAERRVQRFCQDLAAEFEVPILTPESGWTILFLRIHTILRAKGRDDSPNAWSAISCSPGFKPFRVSPRIGDTRWLVSSVHDGAIVSGTTDRLAQHSGHHDEPE